MSVVFRRRRSIVSLKGLENSFVVDEAGPFLRGVSIEDESEVDGTHDPLNDNIGVQDLAALQHLTDESIVAELKKRYDHMLIYTNVGDILIAVNPFQDLPTLYGEEAAKRYFHTGPNCPTPHVYRVAQQAYKMLLHQHKNQCCVISGESGAGKTETAKFLVEQILAMCKGTGKLEQRIVEVSPLLEAFGNAKTVMNDNSSRFGKYLEVKFGYFGDVLGATLSEYLLEKSRVVRQGDGERNFHVFYYIFCGLSESELKKLHLLDITRFHYLRGGQHGLTRESVIDLDEMAMHGQYQALRAVMSSIGFTSQEILDLHQSLAVILHIGNISFQENDSGFAELRKKDPVERVSDLGGIDLETLEFMMVATQHLTRGELLQKNFNLEKAEDNRDAMAKAIYGRLFAWIVKRANDLLRPRGTAYDLAKDRENGIKAVGILDIFGFENFEINSFEQLCINVANEQLQYFFNQHIFAQELNCYEEEGIPSTTISFKDNGDLLDMVFAKPIGLFALLDEESRFPKATAATLVSKFVKAAGQQEWENFEEIRTGQKSSPNPRRSQAQISKSNKNPMLASRSSAETMGVSFAINHYAGKVKYMADKFLEKNRDSLSSVVISNLRASEFDFLSSLFIERVNARGSFSDKKSDMRRTKASVSASFKASLLDLITRMKVAQPHFIRCIKPNDLKKAGAFNPDRVATQLKYTGVLETTRIRRDGYSFRIPYRHFLDKYQTLAFKGSDLKNWLDEEAVYSLDALQSAATRIIRRCGLRGAQLGNTLVFLKYYHNEKILRLMEKQEQMATVLTKNVRMFLAVKLRQRLKKERDEELARIERERKEEQLRKEREAAEKAAEEARKAAEELERQEKAELKRMETIKRKKQEEARKRAEELQRQAEEARKQAEEAQRKAEEEKRRKEQEEEEKRRMEEEQKEREREERRKRMQEQAEQQAQLRRGSIVSIGSIISTVHGEHEEQDDEDEFNFLLEEYDGVSSAELAQLRQNMQKRQMEEEARRRKLRAEHEEQKRLKEQEEMREIQRIEQEELRRQKEEQEALAQTMQESQQRMNELSFGAFAFSWGDSSSNATSNPNPSTDRDKTPEPAPESQIAFESPQVNAVPVQEPVPISKVKSAPPQDSLDAIPTTQAHSETPKETPKKKPPPPVSPKPPSPKMRNRNSVSAPNRKSGPPTSPKPKKKPPPTSPKPSKKVISERRASTIQQEPEKQSEEPAKPRRKLIRSKPPSKPTPVLKEWEEAMSALTDLSSFLDEQDSIPISREKRQPEKPSPPPPEQIIEQPPTNESSSVSDKPRKLIRKVKASKPTPVLKEWQEAMDALSDLNNFLDQVESVDAVLQADNDMLLKRGSSVLSRRSSRRKSRSNSTSPDRPLSNSPRLENVTPRAQSSSSPRLRSPKSHKTPRGASSPSLIQHRHIASMSSQQSLDLIDRVKSGDISVEDAVDEVVDSRNRSSNCSIQ